MSRIENSEIDGNIAIESKREESYVAPDISSKTISSDLLIEESEANIDEKKLLYNKNKNYFLTKVGAIGTFYLMTCCLTCLLIIYDNPGARTYYWLYRLRKMTWVYVLLSVMLKLTFGFAGHLLYKFGFLFLLVDIYYSFMAVMGLYFYFNVYLQTMYITDGAYVILAIFILTANSIAFILSTLKKDSVRIYNYLFGFILMEVSTLITMFLFRMKYDIMTMGDTRYYGIFIVFTIINIYIVINAYYLVNSRGKKYYDHEYIYGYYSFWTDWFSSLWIDLLEKNKGHRRKTIVDRISYETDSEDVENGSSYENSDNFEENPRNQVDGVNEN